MKKFILFTDGILSARYDSEIHGDAIPAGAVPVSEDLFVRTYTENDGVWSLVNGKVVKLPPPPKPLADFKTEKLNEIRDAYKAAEIEPVDALSKTWNGGFDSAIKLDAARRLSEAAGAPGVNFYDINNTEHGLSFADALQVCITVAGAYQNTLSKKQRLFKEVEAVQVSETMTEAQAIEAVAAINW